jgi:Zn-finger nucleic acid-binding protein
VSSDAKNPYRTAGEANSFCFLCGSEGAAGSMCQPCLVERPLLTNEVYLARHCPRCVEALVGMPVGGGAHAEVCTRCHGIFASPRAWARFWRAPDAASELERRFPVPERGASLMAFVHCATCKREMERARFANTSDVVIDVCSLGHGIWLDAGELGRVLAYAKYLETEGREKHARDAELDSRIEYEKSRVDAERAARQFGAGIVTAAGRRLLFDD